MKRINQSEPALAAALPQTGDRVYVPSISHCRGYVDQVGGLATVVAVTTRMVEDKVVTFVAVDVAPHFHFNWNALAAEQAELKREFGEHPAIAGPILLSA